MTDYVAAPSPDFQKLDTSSWLTKYAAIIIILYLAAGTAGFVYFEADGESPLEWTDACYFCVITLTTVGYGDLAPTTDESKLFAIGYIVLGLSIVATSLGALAGAAAGPDFVFRDAASTSPFQRYLYQAFIAVVRVVVVCGVGATFVFFNEGWGVLDSIYWSVVTASTVGYGDIEVEQETTRQFLVVYALVAVGAFATSLSKFGSIIMDVEAEKHVDAFVERGVSIGMLHDIKANGGADTPAAGGTAVEVERGEFVQYMLVAMGKVSQEDLDKVLGMFDALDEDGSGRLDADDIIAAQRKREGGGTAPIAPAAEDAPPPKKKTRGFLATLTKPLLGN